MYKLNNFECNGVLNGLVFSKIIHQQIHFSCTEKIIFIFLGAVALVYIYMFVITINTKQDNCFSIVTSHYN